MTVFEIILLAVGIIILLLALCSGVKIFQKASNDSADENSGGMGSLWFLFLVGILGGLLFIWLALNSISPAIIGWGILAVTGIGLILGIMALLG